MPVWGRGGEGGGERLGCMGALYGAGKSQTIRLPAVILRVIVSGERQKALHRTGMHSVRAKLLSPVTYCPVGFFSSVFNPNEND